MPPRSYCRKTSAVWLRLANRQTPGFTRSVHRMSEFGNELARLMTARGVGVRELARQVPCNPGHISNLKNSRARPSPELALALDTALAADGQLVAAWEASRQPVPASPLASIAPDADLYGRITRAIDEPLRIDVPVVKWLEHTLAEHRRVEDSVSAHAPCSGSSVPSSPRWRTSPTAPGGRWLTGWLAWPLSTHSSWPGCASTSTITPRGWPGTTRARLGAGGRGREHGRDHAVDEGTHGLEHWGSTAVRADGAGGPLVGPAGHARRAGHGCADGSPRPRPGR